MNKYHGYGIMDTVTVFLIKVFLITSFIKTN